MPKYNVESSNARHFLYRRQRSHALAITWFPCAGVMVALFEVFRVGVSYFEIAVLALMYSLTFLGITVGFHRLFTHRSFQTSRALRQILAICGSMAAQGPIVYWVSNHRCHHQFSDREGDPHSPNMYGSTSDNLLSRLWHAHVGWIFDHDLPNPGKYAKDLLHDPTIMRINRAYYWWIVLGIALPTAVGILVTHSWLGGLKGLLWGGLVRIFLSQQATYCINSICHYFGSRPYQTREHSTNNFWLALPTFGESWHNNHHAFPYSSMFGMHWWQLDIGAWTILLLEKLRLVSDVKRPPVPPAEGKTSEVNP